MSCYRTDLLQLQDLESAIFDIIIRKTNIIRPIVIHYNDLIATFLKINVPLKNSTLEIMRNHVKNIAYILIHTIGESDYIFTNQIKLYTTDSIIQK